jgi:serine/threonine protein kinase/tetratricopeptide (TPR) repeat protein
VGVDDRRLAEGTVAGTVPARAAAAARDAELQRGTSVGRYVLLEPLGQGGMGVVYKAYDPELDRSIALKLLLAGEDQNEAQRERLLREAQALARLAHPNVLAVHDVGTFRGSVFIAMELVEGRTLRSWLGEPGRTQPQILEAFLAAGDGLAAAHRAGLVHRDFKPDNVMIGHDGRVRVLDFGLARIAQAGADDARPARDAVAPPDDDAATPRPVDLEPTIGDRRSGRVTPSPPAPHAGASSPEQPTPSGGEVTPNLLSAPLTHVGSTVGTPRFMAPEQHLGQPTDARADQFSFCVSLYYALYGAFPFAGGTADTIRDSILLGGILEPPTGATVPRWLRQVLVKGLAPRPADRYPSMEALLVALRADPRLARRRWLGAAALLVVVASAAVGARVVNRREVRACAGGAAKLAGVWDEPRRAAVRAAFHRSGRPYADAALTAVERTFDAYAQAWTAMHADSCEATHLRHEQSQELLDLRMSCLQGRLTGLGALAEQFAGADDAMIKNAARSAQALPDLQLCADTVALKAPVPPPRDPAAHRRVEEARLALARAYSLGLAAHFDEAVRLASGAGDEAEALGYAPLIADVQLRLGTLLAPQGDIKAAAERFHRAFAAALLGHHEEAAAAAAVELVYAVGVHLGQPDEGHHWAEVADALTQRLKRDSLRASFQFKRAGLFLEQGKYADALRDAKEALALQQRGPQPDDLAVAQSDDLLGEIHFHLAEYGEALADYERALDRLKHVLGPDHPQLSGVMIGMADVYGEQGEHERALAQYGRALDFLLRVQPDHPNVAAACNNMGLTLLMLGRPRDAFAQFERAYVFWLKHGPRAVDAALSLGNMGYAQINMGQPSEALGYFQRAIDMKALGPENAEYGRLLAGMGDASRKQGRLDEALRKYEQAIAVYEKALGLKHPYLIGPLAGIARVELERRAGARARVPLDRALAIAEAQPDPATLAEVHFLLAQSLWATGDAAHAITLATQARDGYAKAGAPSRKSLDEVTAWLKAPGRPIK